MPLSTFLFTNLHHWIFWWSADYNCHLSVRHAANSFQKIAKWTFLNFFNILLKLLTLLTKKSLCCCIPIALNFCPEIHFWSRNYNTYLHHIKKWSIELICQFHTSIKNQNADMIWYEFSKRFGLPKWFWQKYCQKKLVN